MRAVGTGDEHAVKRKQSAQTFSIVLLVLLVVSSLGYAFLSNSNLGGTVQQNTGGSSAVQNIGPGQWALTEGSQQILLTTSPEAAANVSIQGTAPSIGSFAGQSIYIDASDEITYELQTALAPYAGRLQQACYGNCTKDLPEKDCNSTLIVWKNTANQRIYQQDRCYFIDGDKQAVDAFVYSLFNEIRR